MKQGRIFSCGAPLDTQLLEDSSPQFTKQTLSVSHRPVLGYSKEPPNEFHDPMSELVQLIYFLTFKKETNETPSTNEI